MIEQGCARSALLDGVEAAYSGDREAMRDALAAFTDELCDEKLVIEQLGEPDMLLASAPLANTLTERAMFNPPLLEKYTDMQDLLLIDPIHEVNDEHGWPKMKT